MDLFGLKARRARRELAIIEREAELDMARDEKRRLEERVANDRRERFKAELVPCGRLAHCPACLSSNVHRTLEWKEFRTFHYWHEGPIRVSALVDPVRHLTVTCECGNLVGFERPADEGE